MTDIVDFPSDVLPDSRSRVPLPRRDELDASARSVYDAHVHIDPASGKSLAGLYGPGGLRLHSKKLSGLAAPAAHYLRHGADYTEQEREVAILVTAREHDAHLNGGHTTGRRGELGSQKKRSISYVIVAQPMV